MSYGSMPFDHHALLYQTRSPCDRASDFSLIPYETGQRIFGGTPNAET